MQGLVQRYFKALTVTGQGHIGSEEQTFSEEVVSEAADGCITVFSLASPTEKQFLRGAARCFLSLAWISFQNLDTLAFASSNLPLSSLMDRGMFRSSTAWTKLMIESVTLE